MTAIGGGNQPSNSHQRKLAHSEEWIAKYKERVGTYPATPIELSPNNGVPTGGQLDTFHKMAQDLGVTVTSDVKETIALPNDVILIRENALPVGVRGYDQLLRTITSIVTNSHDFLERVQKIAFEKADAVEASMDSAGELGFAYISPTVKTISYENPPKNPVLPTGYESRLDSINPYGSEWEGSLLNPTLTTEHEGVHDLLMGACREFIETSKLTAGKPMEMANSIMNFYTTQLYYKNPTIINNALKNTMLTDYFHSEPQELFTTLFEAKASEIASRTPITQEMAAAVGSTVEHLTQQKDAYLPTVSAEQREQLTALINLIKDTPFDLQGWWENQHNLDYDLIRSLNLPPVDYSNLPEVDNLLSEDFFRWDFKDGAIDTFANLDKDHPKLDLLHDSIY